MRCLSDAGCWTLRPDQSLVVRLMLVQEVAHQIVQAIDDFFRL